MHPVAVLACKGWLRPRQPPLWLQTWCLRVADVASCPNQCTNMQCGSTEIRLACHALYIKARGRASCKRQAAQGLGIGNVLL